MYYSTGYNTEMTRGKKRIALILSFFVTIISLSVLLYIVFVYKSHTVYEIEKIDAKLEYEDGLLVSDDCAYLYNEYGGSLSKSNLFSLPIYQYDGPEADYLYYKFDTKYYAASRENQLLSPANTQTTLMLKYEGIVYEVDIENKSCKKLLSDCEIHSVSLGGTYYLEISDNRYAFYKLNKDELCYSSAMQLQSDFPVEFCFWLNDRYLLVKTYTDTSVLYNIVDASNGEATVCGSINNNVPENQKKLFSDKYLISDIDSDRIDIFDIYTQETVKFKLKNAEKYTVLQVSNDASYAIVEKDGETFLISKKGKILSFKDITGNNCSDSFFIKDNIMVAVFDDGTSCYSSIYKIIF